MNNNKNISTGSSTLATLLTIAFVVLKLTDVIAWSWWWVLSPLWISFAIALIIFIMMLIVAILRK